MDVASLASSKGTSSSLADIVKQAAGSIGFDLKREQEESIMQLVSGKDVFVSLPTGFGKSLCYTILPLVFDLLSVDEEKSIVLVVSPLVALMKDQVATISNLGVSAVYATDREATHKNKSLTEGSYQIIFISPEALFRGTRWRKILSSDTYKRKLAAFVVDEAHCIKKWYGYTSCSCRVSWVAWSIQYRAQNCM
jgi:superfamily II DNA helicase RecQ